jgi:CheY-like chemotaxis protein
VTARILLCEDDGLAKSWMASALRDGGFEVTEASSVDDCLKSAAAGTYDLAVLDVMMPGGELDWIETKGGFATGVAVARRLKQQCPDMKIVGISQAPVFETLQWFRANADGFIVKAELLSDPGAIVERIRKVIDPAGWLKRCRSFIVHGHDRRALRALQDHLRAFGFPPPTDGPDYYRIVVAPNEHERGEDWVDVTEKACADDWLAAAAHALRAGGQEIRVRISGPRAEVTLRWPRSYGRP